MNNISGLPREYREILQGCQDRVKDSSQRTSHIGDPKKAEFKDIIGDFIKDVDKIQKVTEQKIKDYASGEITDIHEVMIAAEEANLSFQLMMEVRNKLLESYRDIMRMQS